MLTLKLPTSWHKTEPPEAEWTQTTVIAQLEKRPAGEKAPEVRARSVLVYAGTSPAAADAVLWGLRMARITGAGLRLLGIEPPARPYTAGAEAATGPPAGPDDRRDVSLRFEGMFFSAKGRDRPKEGSLPEMDDARMVKGTSLAVLFNEINDPMSATLVLPADGLTDRKAETFHIIAESLHRADLNLLLVRPPESEGLHDITMLVDFSAPCVAAARLACSFASSYGGALRFVHPYHLPVITVDYLAVGTLSELVDNEMMYNTAAYKRLETWLAECGLQTKDATLVCREVPHWNMENAFVRALAQERPDLLVLPMRHHPWMRTKRQIAFLQRVLDCSAGSLLVVKSS